MAYTSFSCSGGGSIWNMFTAWEYISALYSSSSSSLCRMSSASLFDHGKEQFHTAADVNDLKFSNRKCVSHVSCQQRRVNMTFGARINSFIPFTMSLSSPYFNKIYMSEFCCRKYGRYAKRHCKWYKRVNPCCWQDGWLNEPQNGRYALHA